MNLKDVIKLENKAKEVWVITPTLYYDLENKNFTELVSVNLGEKTKYRYIVPASKEIRNNVEKYKKAFGVTEEEIQKMFCFIQETDFGPFINELAIYNGTSEPVSVSTPPTESSNEVIKYSEKTAERHAKAFVDVWKKYKRTKP
ncbi:MAG: hypothetical protein IPN29_13160 [Saprospiraceae bacterium]|nr:hypothetical protein [Saprospiraceae bacterium]